MSQENLELVRRLWEAAQQRNREAVFALYDPDIVWESRDVGPIELGGHYHGHEGVRKFFRDWLESFESYEARAESFVEVGDKVVVGYRVTGRGRGSGIETEMVRWNIYEIRAGLIVRVEVFETQSEALAAAASGP